MGHRAEKQRRQREGIKANTVALVRQQGADGFRIRDVVARSGISGATFFNYFEGKDAVLREWLDDQIEAGFERARIRHAEGAALRRVLRTLVREVAEAAVDESRVVEAAAHAVRFVSIGEENASVALRGRSGGASAAVQLLEESRLRGEVRADLDSAQVASLLRAALLTALVGAFRAPLAPSTDQLVPALRASLDLMVDGLRKRNERVRAQGSVRRAVSGPAGN